MYVKMPTKHTVELCIVPPFTTDHIKQVISKEEGMHPFRQRLTFEGRMLDDGHSLDEYNVQYGSTLDLVIRPGSRYMYMIIILFMECVVIFIAYTTCQYLSRHRWEIFFWRLSLPTLLGRSKL